MSPTSRLLVGETPIQIALKVFKFIESNYLNMARRKSTLDQQEWLKIPVDYDCKGLTDFKGLIAKQQNILSSNTNTNSSNESLLSSFWNNLNNKKSFNTEKKSNGHKPNNKFNKQSSIEQTKRFWMSDKNCIRCSECGDIFHTFRRKHHCRLCGRVFCQGCCSERVNRRDSGMMIRVCVYCSDNLQKHDESLGIPMTFPNDVNPTENIQSITKKYKDSINVVYDNHIKYVIKQLCHFEDLNEEWEQLIFKYCKTANDTIFNYVLCSANDIGDYIKVKRIEGGLISECKLIDGVIFRKNVAHRKMRINIDYPKILLLDHAIEYHRMNSPFYSFDITLKQNEEYMKMIVDKICDLGLIWFYLQFVILAICLY